MLCDDCKVSNVNRSDRVDTVVCTSLPAMNRAMKMFLEANETKAARRIREKYMIISKENQEQGKEARIAHKGGCEGVLAEGADRKGEPRLPVLQEAARAEAWAIRQFLWVLGLSQVQIY